MELRVLRYFLAVAQEQSISGAAESLHLSQPTLSTQLKHLEEELGKQLFYRGTKGSRRIALTEEGMILRKRAEELLELAEKTQREIALSSPAIAGDVYIGAGETEGFRIIAQAAREVQLEYPGIRFHISSGDARDVLDQLDKGLVDFGLLLHSADLAKYASLSLSAKDVWGVLMRRDSPLAGKETIAPADLWDQPLIVSRQASKGTHLSAWLQRDWKSLNVVATYSLLYNGSLLVEEGVGYALCLDKILNVSGSSRLCFRPFLPKLEAGMNLVWKKHHALSSAAEAFLLVLRQMAAKSTPTSTP